MSKPIAFLLILISFFIGNAAMLRLVVMFFGRDAEAVFKDQLTVSMSRWLFGEDSIYNRPRPNLKTAYYSQNRKSA